MHPLKLSPLTQASQRCLFYHIPGLTAWGPAMTNRYHFKYHSTPTPWCSGFTSHGQVRSKQTHGQLSSQCGGKVGSRKQGGIEGPGRQASVLCVFCFAALILQIMTQKTKISCRLSHVLQLQSRGSLTQAVIQAPWISLVEQCTEHFNRKPALSQDLGGGLNQEASILPSVRRVLLTAQCFMTFFPLQTLYP